MAVKKVAQGAEMDERLAALMTNVNAVRAIASSVEGTIGPKGLDTLLVDKFGDIVITNDGMTILTKMEVNHPAARMVINTAKAQEEEVGDGTTTATILAGALLSEGVNQVMRGVPVTRVIDGVKMGISQAIRLIQEHAVRIDELDDPLLEKVALIAGRENRDIAELTVRAAKMVGKEKLLDKRFKLKDAIVAKEGADNEAFSGIIIDKKRLNQEMPDTVENALILALDDALEPEEVEEEALATESGFRKYLDLREEFKADLEKIVRLGVNFICVDKGVSDIAEEILQDAGVLVVSRVFSADLRKLCEHTGAKPIKRTGLKKPAKELERYLGRAERIEEDERLECIRVLGGKGKPMATILVGASTQEVRGERERIATDAASAVQAAVRGGVVAGGGAFEIFLAKEIEKLRQSQKGMQAYGLLCVIEALKTPLAQIVANAGFNPLEKVGEVAAEQAEKGNPNLGIDCDMGEVRDMTEMGVFDPALVKVHALKAAMEIACAILRIDTIIKMKSSENDNSSVPMEDMKV